MNPTFDSNDGSQDHTAVLYKIALKNIPRVGAVTARNLISYCGGLEAVFKTPVRTLKKIPGVGETLARNIRNADILRAAEGELKYIIKHDIRVLFYLDDDYPKRLIPFVQSPILLYYRGNQDLNALRCLSVVGTRKPTEYGKQWCTSCIRDLAGLDIVIVSGLAYGIDITAHRAALQHGLPTIAVLGSGHGRIYPGQHKPVVRRMLDRGGVLTEFEYLTSPDKEHFPARNRIIAAMSDAVLVVESAARGGSVITAEFANSFNRDVFALPGRSGDASSEGCNALIKTHRAHLVESAEDIAMSMGWIRDDQNKAVQPQLFTELTDAERLVLEAIQKEKQMHIDYLSALVRLPLSELAAILLSLEFKGIVKSLPGKRFSVQ